MTGKRLFLMYAMPCVDFRLKEGSITKKDAEELQSFLDEKRDPDGEFLAICFPRAVRALREYAKESLVSGPNGMWGLNTVRSYWMDHHLGDTPVLHGPVMTILDEHIIWYESRRLSCMATNKYNLKIKIGSIVYVHNYEVIEVCDPE